MQEQEYDDAVFYVASHSPDFNTGFVTDTAHVDFGLYIEPFEEDELIAAIAEVEPIIIFIEVPSHSMDVIDFLDKLKASNYKGVKIAISKNPLEGDMEKRFDSFSSLPLSATLVVTLISNNKPKETSSINSFFQDPKYKMFIQEFLKTLPEKLETLQQYIDQDNFEEIHRLSHKLKGQGGSFGFHEITELAGKIEEHAQRENMLAIKSELKLLHHYVKGVM